jgi:hypothetical protein
MQVSDLLPSNDYQKGHLLEMMRELLEWAALLKLAFQKGPLLLLRDGLLRSVLMTDRLYRAFDERLRDLTMKNGHFLAGVAKRSSVVNYLSMAFSIENALPADRPSYVAVPAELEREASPASYRWMSERSMGRLHLARLDVGAVVPVFPVDVAEWQSDKVGVIMALLQRSARGEFPVRGYPRELLEAHEHARIGAIDQDLLKSMILDELTAIDEAAARHAREAMILGHELLEEEGEP